MKLVTVAELTGHTGRIWSCAWNPTGTMLASCGEDKTIRLWRKDSNWSCSTVLTEGHSRTVRSVAWSPCGTYLVTASFDGTVAVWSNKSGSWECNATLEGHENEVKCSAFSQSGQYLASCSRDKSVWLWDVDYEDDEYMCASVLHSHTQDVKKVAWHPQSDILASASYDNTIKIFREDDDDWICINTLSSHTNTVWSLAWDSQGERLASCSEDTTVKIWQSFPPGNREGIPTEGKDPGWRCQYTIAGVHPRSIYDLDWDKQGNIITVGGDDAIRIFSEEEGEWVCQHTEYSAHAMDINAISSNTNEPSLLATCSDDETVKIWRIER